MTIGDDNLDLTGVKVLIIDDSKTIRRTAETLLTKAGCSVITAADGFEALGKIVDDRPDLIFVDIMMPRLDGVDTTRLIRRNRNYAGTVVVALSARADEETRQKMKEAGANLFMRKPFVIAKLVDRVARMLAARPQAK